MVFLPYLFLTSFGKRYDRRTYRRLVEEAAKVVFNAAGAELFPKVDPLQASLC